MEGDQKVEAAARVCGRMRCFSLNRERVGDVNKVKK
jgi:hypothetical protein